VCRPPVCSTVKVTIEMIRKRFSVF